jgi:hypothetical protein
MIALLNAKHYIKNVFPMTQAPTLLYMRHSQLGKAVMDIYLDEGATKQLLFRSIISMLQ